MTGIVACQGCGATVPDIEESRGSSHPNSATGCWLLYTEVLAREYGDLRYTPAHVLTVDAQAVLHPGVPEPRFTQQIAIHLVGLT